MCLSICSAEAHTFKAVEQHGSIVVVLIDSCYKKC